MLPIAPAPAVADANLARRRSRRAAGLATGEGQSKGDDLVLGFTMIGAEAGEVIAAVQNGDARRLPYPMLRCPGIIVLP
jgi:hypothetical protein